MKFGSKMVADWKEDQTMAAKLLKFGAPGGIRTPNPQIRSLVLCPIELRASNEAEISDAGRLWKAKSATDNSCGADLNLPMRPRPRQNSKDQRQFLRTASVFSTEIMPL